MCGEMLAKMPKISKFIRGFIIPDDITSLPPSLADSSIKYIKNSGSTLKAYSDVVLQLEQAFPCVEFCF